MSVRFVCSQQPLKRMSNSKTDQLKEFHAQELRSKRFLLSCQIRAVMMFFLTGYAQQGKSFTIQSSSKFLKQKDLL